MTEPIEIPVRRGEWSSNCCDDCRWSVIQAVRRDGERDATLDRVLGRKNPLDLTGDFAEAYREGYQSIHDAYALRIDIAGVHTLEAPDAPKLPMLTILEDSDGKTWHMHDRTLRIFPSTGNRYECQMCEPTTSPSLPSTP